ncbi:hypothetical protein [Idiomarina abyssalis]|uniref:hypothetical protein n=1 Tax=Idiomarina abyssalis TaxID=86102 RepID=UPI003A8D1B9E
MNYILRFIITFFVTISASDALAQAPTIPPDAGNETEVKPTQVLMCNATFESKLCSTFTDSKLIYNVRNKFGDYVPEDCSFNCSYPSLPTMQVDFLIVDVRNGLSQRKTVIQSYFSGQTTYNVVSSPLKDSDYELATKLLQADNEYVRLKRKYSFSRNANGVWVNNSNQTLSNLGMSSSEIPVSASNSAGNCQTAYDYYSDSKHDDTLPGCAAILTSVFSSEYNALRDERSVGHILIDWLNERSIQLFGDHISYEKLFNHPISFHYDDGSKLVLLFEETESGIRVSVDKKASRVSNGTTFERFEQSLTQGYGEVDASLDEALSLFRGFNCGYQLTSSMIVQTLSIQVLERDSSGKPTRVEIKLISQDTINESRFTCSAPM